MDAPASSLPPRRSASVPSLSAAERFRALPHQARRGLLWGAAGLGLFVLLGGLAHLYLNSESMRAQLHAQLAAALKGRGIEVDLGDHFDVDLFGRMRVGPVTVRAEGERHPVLTVTEVRLRPRYHAILQGHAELASVTLKEGVLDVGMKGERLSEFIAHVRGARPRGNGHTTQVALANPPKLRIEGMTLQGAVPGVDAPLRVGPLDGEVVLERAADAKTLEASATLPGKGTLHFSAGWGGGTPLHADLSGDDVDIEAIPGPVRARLPLQVQQGTAGFHLVLESEPSLRTGNLQVEAAVRELTVQSARLDPEPVGPLNAAVHAAMRWDRSRHKVRLDDAILALGARGQFPIHVSAELGYSPPYQFRVDSHVDAVPYQDATSALPPQLAPGPGTPQPEGPVSAQVLVQGALHDPESWAVDVRLDVDGLKDAERGKPSVLKDGFEYHPTDAQGHMRNIWIGEKNPAYVPLSQLPPYVVRAVTTSEDAGFFGHHGFDFDEIKDSILSAVEERRVRGASTITQQLAKNLFLSREKTLSRKVREAFITLALEAALTKQRLLEIYLNCIEWGPGIYGIGEAAPYYFGRDARQLTPKQAAFLATIIPNPIKYNVYYQRGELTETWVKRVHDLLVKMRSVDIIDEAQFEEAEATPVSFRAH